MRQALFVGHLVVAVGLVGADLALLVLGVAGVAGLAPVAVYPAASLVASRVLAPLAGLALLTGLAQAAVTGRGLLRERWLTVKLVVTLALTALVGAVLLPRLAVDAAVAAVGDPLPAGRLLPLALVPGVVTVLLVGLVALAVTKPGRRRVDRTAGGR